MLRLYADLLATTPFSACRAGFASLVVRVVDPAEAPASEHDLRNAPLDSGELAGLAGAIAQADTALEALAHWDLWSFDPTAQNWQEKPERLEICCYGTEYDAGAAAVEGHFQIDAGFEHFFTGHSGLLGNGARRQPQHTAEAEFLSLMSAPERLREYREHTRKNILKFIGWMRVIEKQLTVERVKLWSEGEENIESRLEEILAAR